MRGRGAGMGDAASEEEVDTRDPRVPSRASPRALADAWSG